MDLNGGTFSTTSLLKRRFCIRELLYMQSQFKSACNLALRDSHYASCRLIHACLAVPIASGTR